MNDNELRAEFDRITRMDVMKAKQLQERMQKAYEAMLDRANDEMDAEADEKLVEANDSVSDDGKVVCAGVTSCVMCTGACYADEAAALSLLPFASAPVLPSSSSGIPGGIGNCLGSHLSALGGPNAEGQPRPIELPPTAFEYDASGYVRFYTNDKGQRVTVNPPQFIDEKVGVLTPYGELLAIKEKWAAEAGHTGGSLSNERVPSSEGNGSHPEPNPLHAAMGVPHTFPQTSGYVDIGDTRYGAAEHSTGLDTITAEDFDRIETKIETLGTADRIIIEGLRVIAEKLAEAAPTANNAMDNSQATLNEIDQLWQGIQMIGETLINHGNSNKDIHHSLTAAHLGLKNQGETMDDLATSMGYPVQGKTLHQKLDAVAHHVEKFLKAKKPDAGIGPVIGRVLAKIEDLEKNSGPTAGLRSAINDTLDLVTGIRKDVDNISDAIVGIPNQQASLNQRLQGLAEYAIRAEGQNRAIADGIEYLKDYTRSAHRTFTERFDQISTRLANLEVKNGH